MRPGVICTAALAGLALLYLLSTFESRRPPSPPTTPAKPAPLQLERPSAAGGPLKIVQFYAYPAVIAEGEHATLCYGVTGAASLSLEPAIETVFPADNRCFTIAPDDNTRYTLTARDARGRAVSASFVLAVKPDPAARPRIVYFVQQPQRDRSLHSLCFQAENVREVQVDPPVLPPNSAPRGCFYVAPQRTTTYTLTVIGPKGRRVHRQLTVKVP